MLETSVRVLRLLAMLARRREWSGAELAARLDVSGRTVRNDVDRLRQLGYQVDAVPGRGGGYRLGAGNALPPLVFEDDEAVAVAVGLRAAAAGSVAGIEDASLRALTKLEQTLPRRLRARVDALKRATVSAAGGGPVVDLDTLTRIAAAANGHERLRFEYAAHGGDTSVRDVEPHTLVYTGRRWYLLAWDGDRRDWRTFRADRITPLPVDGPVQRFVPREPPGGDAAAHVLRGVVEAPHRYRVRIRFAAPAAVIAERSTPTSGRITPLGERECELATGADSLFDLMTYVGKFEVPFTVLDPPELRDFLRTLAGRYLEAAGDR
ncbi:helix-turn-helix transcriptional regulator [Dactylosporangium matsuzakiense]|uniref:DNA-binding transcriptional regulator n=1 Tax=Dactylosporangium matsuzakiense TaxID=53360 RepID=A0A9W6KWQ0_9ACTN|nr:YafY family protein [Dactylosporangium matsuzakiense]UWZ48203.1 YafY family transcriptional regulator [Dactylosporangium matsuzakiense]GLL08089.1 DNA-binding transcriptional regulator [Dactylosporangium matsuzakiense]